MSFYSEDESYEDNQQARRREQRRKRGQRNHEDFEEGREDPFLTRGSPAEESKTRTTAPPPPPTSNDTRQSGYLFEDESNKLLRPRSTSRSNQDYANSGKNNNNNDNNNNNAKKAFRRVFLFRDEQTTEFSNPLNSKASVVFNLFNCKNLLLLLCLIALGIHVVFLGISYGLNIGFYPNLFGNIGQPVTLTLFCFFHACLNLGIIHGIAFFLISIIVSLFSQYLSVSQFYLLSYDPLKYFYLQHFDDGTSQHMISPQNYQSISTISNIPLDVPFQEFTFFYLCFTMAEVILFGIQRSRYKDDINFRIPIHLTLLLPIITSFIYFGWGLVMEPLSAMFQIVSYTIPIFWQFQSNSTEPRHGPHHNSTIHNHHNFLDTVQYMGVPIMYFISQWITVLLVCVLYLAIEYGLDRLSVYTHNRFIKTLYQQSQSSLRQTRRNYYDGSRDNYGSTSSVERPDLEDDDHDRVDGNYLIYASSTYYQSLPLAKKLRFMLVERFIWLCAPLLSSSHWIYFVIVSLLPLVAILAQSLLYILLIDPPFLRFVATITFIGPLLAAGIKFISYAVQMCSSKQQQQQQQQQQSYNDLYEDQIN